MKTKLINSLAAIVAIVGISTLVGCSSSGSDGTDATVADTAAVVLEGTFVDSHVVGLNYKGTLTGKTDASGHYSFVAGDQVEFLIGTSISLGSLAASVDPVSPLDFFGGTKSVNDQEVKNLLVLLQSLDTDGDATNGIQILPEAVTALENTLVADGKTLTTVDFTTMSSGELKTTLDLVVAATPSPYDDVVTEGEATEHFSEVMSGDITVRKNISRTPMEGSSGHRITKLLTIVDSQTASGDINSSVQTHPLLISYADQILGDFEMGTGSAQIGDPEHIKDAFVSISLDGGETWKAKNVSDTAQDSSIDVDYYGTGSAVAFKGHSYRPIVKAEGNNILVAWLDKYCPKQNPFKIDTNVTADLYLVNGPQGTIDYEGAETLGDVALTNMHEVPFNCVWTTRGVFEETNSSITWHDPMQLTSGRRDANKLTIDANENAFVLAWQEDPTGLRPGKGAGPGDGWSGASTNHKTDIWYSYIANAGFGDINTTVTSIKPKSLYSLSMPVPITDNAVCNKTKVDANTSAPYCADMCANNGFLDDNTSNDDQKCYSSYNDPILELYATVDSNLSVPLQLLNGDTGASRAVIGLFGTTVVFGYEETKGMAESLPGIPNSDPDAPIIDPEDQGKVAYFESFEYNNPVTVSPGNIINPLRPNEADGSMVLENVRRLTLIRQVDYDKAMNPANDAEYPYKFGILYKSGVETQGESSDMYLRLATGYDYASFDDNISWNLSAHTSVIDGVTDGGEDIVVDSTWTPDNINDNTWDNLSENTFSPRGFLRGREIYVGYEYTRSWRVTQNGHLPNNFHVIRSMDNGVTWLEPFDVSQIVTNNTSTLDPRFIATAEELVGSPLASDISNPNVMFVTYGTFDLGTGLELDLFVSRSTDKGETWEQVVSNADENLTINEAIAKTEAEEKEVQNIAAPNGKTLFSVWLQELDPAHTDASIPDYLYGSDIWAQRKDYNSTD
ncbi:hypothetical protein HUE87_03500 [Candidatus Sulfurimonas marisnigri]|uniref:Exo-alpha-sialidase n=1 Tax=Candidatus Sulfurimonas marisnigri TaxID=2740405 RepID=A0A7S7RR33_9BACT|nr:choice-of-anchor O protein [Candidatus Sulfurimonas marisnigri]QOY55316.1 hypothetical protein HUE87_03500 [Candidatus Sulfurimonas marisnigri]